MQGIKMRSLNARHDKEITEMLGMTKRSRYAKHEDEITECKA